MAQSPTTQVPGTAVPADQVPPELFDAIAAYVNQNIGNYLGDCNETPLDAGPGWCSGVEKLTATTAHVGIGVDRSGIFADPINLERQPDGSWEVVSVGPAPPDTGTGQAAPDSGIVWPLVLALFVAGALAAALGANLLVVRGRQ